MHRDGDNGGVCRIVGRCRPAGVARPEYGARLERVRHAEAAGQIIWVQYVVVVVPDASGIEILCYRGGDGVSGTGECGFAIGCLCGWEVGCVLGQGRCEGVGLADGVELGVLEVRVVVLDEDLDLVCGGGVVAKVGAFVGVVADEDGHADEVASFEVVVEVGGDQVAVYDGQPVP